MMKRTILILLLITGFIGLKAQEIITDRPDQTESSSTIPNKSFQLESGVYLGNIDIENRSERISLIPTVLLRYGLTRTFELRLVEQVVNLKNKSTSENIFGFSDLELGAKIQILKKETINSEIAFITHLLIPTGTDSLTNENFGSINKVAISHVLNDFLDLGYNVGYNYFFTGNGDLTYSLALGVGLSKKVGTYFEVFGEIAELNDWISNFDGGITYLIKDNMQLDFSVGVGLNQQMNYFALGFSWNLSEKQ
jgi:hypothetical protein